MDKFTRHKALLLTALIMFPFVSQTLHIIFHDHHHDAGHIHGIAQESSNSCPAHAGCCSHTIRHGQKHHTLAGTDRAGENDTLHEPVSPVFNGQEFTHLHEECPLCDFELAKFSLDYSVYIFFTEDIISVIYPFFYREPAILYTGNHKLLRAPPLLS
ncbi:MAG: hypothetical protein EA408_04870 [Marinilabiliales bacterium]|nr:MAG: hypothetical protein EA408_04870 [Marinilabiliales bacterium]